MSIRSNRSAGALSGWSNFLGVLLRPWSGRSPLSLLIRGLIQLAIYGFILFHVVRLSNGEYAALPREVESLTGLFVLLSVVFGLLLLMGAAMVVVGALDLVPRRTVTGRVLSVRERKSGDFLPGFAQDMIFARNENGIDRRKPRVEVELDTEDGVRHWTVRSARVRRELRVGSQATLTVSPLVGHVARAETQA